MSKGSAMVIPPKGTPVYFYESAIVNDDPKPGVVLESSPQGVLRVGLYPKAGGEMDVKPTVYHVTHASLRDHAGNPSTAAIRGGGWDYHPWFQAPPAGSEKYLQSAEKVEKVLALARDYPFDVVCAKVRSLGLKSQDVQMIYSDNNLKA